MNSRVEVPFFSGPSGQSGLEWTAAPRQLFVDKAGFHAQVESSLGMDWSVVILVPFLALQKHWGEGEKKVC